MLFLMGIVGVRAVDLPFDDSLEIFLSRMTSDETEKSEFRGYYSRFLRKQSKVHPERKRGKLQNLRIHALNSIEIKDPSLYQVIEPFLIDLDIAQESRNIRLYLTRYALFEEFQRRKIIKHSGLWERAKDGVKRFADRVVEAFKEYSPTKKTS